MPQILQGDKMSNLATKPKFALATLIGLIAGVVSAFVKWGAEVPLPLKNPLDMFKKVPSERQMRSTAREIF